MELACPMEGVEDGTRTSWFHSRWGFNSLIQSAKAKARGYRTPKNFINMAYLILGKLDLRLPT
jgi:hypothetical protein